mmetsp:Transcript_36346/g.65992  ORF Transcript_36346/g.65992 Transcript_36346/m.65992 type:complete len:211 (+) Transcript_36346:1292-1924(+)
MLCPFSDSAAEFLLSDPSPAFQTPGVVLDPFPEPQASDGSEVSLAQTLRWLHPGDGSPQLLTLHAPWPELPVGAARALAHAAAAVVPETEQPSLPLMRPALPQRKLLCLRSTCSSPCRELSSLSLTRPILLAASAKTALTCLLPSLLVPSSRSRLSAVALRPPRCCIASSEPQASSSEARLAALPKPKVKCLQQRSAEISPRSLLASIDL